MLRSHASHAHLIEDVEAPLSLLLADHSCLLQEVRLDVTSQGIRFKVKINVHIFALYVFVYKVLKH